MHSNDVALMTGIFTTLPRQFPIDTNKPYSLSDKEFGGVGFYGMSGRGAVAVDKKDKPLGEYIPAHATQARSQYEKLRTYPFFDRMILVQRNEDQDGMIIAVGVDELYYVLATWDSKIEKVWVPQFEDTGKRLLPVCLGH